MATKKAPAKQAAKKPRGKSAPISDASEKLIQELLLQTKERWLKDSSLAILCCSENREGRA